MAIPEALARGSFSGRGIGAYRIRELIGRGGMGEVYRADDTRLGRAVAVKVLPDRLADLPGSRKRFLREARFACRVVHPYVATVFDVIEDDGRVLLVMEHIAGKRLDAVLREDRPSLERVTQYALEMAEAIGAIHRAGLVHRDLKPGNVMVTPSGHVKVMDFGIARPIAPPELHAPFGASKDSTFTEERGLVGTLLYMSPEQVRGDPVDYRSDLFSFGTILYEAITGLHPFARESALATATAILGEPPGRGTEPKTLSDSGPLRQIVLRLLEKSPRARLPDAPTLVESLRTVQRGEPLGEILPDRSAERSGWIVGSVLAAAGALAVVAVVALGLRPGVGGAGSGGAAAGFRAVRPTVIVLPFRADPSGVQEGSLRAGTVASMLRAGLAQSSLLQVVGSMRTDELLAGADPHQPTPPAKLRPLLDATSARYLVTGDLASDRSAGAGALVASMEIYDREHPDAAIGLRVQADSMPALVDRMAEQVRTRLSPGGAASEGEGARAVPVASIESASEKALLAAESGRQAAGRGELGEADRFYGEAVAEDPRYVRAHMERAKALYQAGYVTRAQEAVQEALDEARSASRPLQARVLKELEAVRCRVHEDRQGEGEALEALTRRYPDEADLWSELADAYRFANRHKEALSAIDQALARSPHDPSHHLQRSASLRRLDLLADAGREIGESERLSAALPGNPLDATILFEKGLLDAARRDFDGALAHLGKASEIFASQGKPLKLAAAQRAIAQVHLQRGQLAEAVSALERAARDFARAGDRGQESICLDSLGALQFQSGRLKEAEETLRKAVALTRATSGDLPAPSPMLNLASLLQTTGRYDEAQLLAQEGLRISRRQEDTLRQSTALLLLAGIEVVRGDFDAGRKTYGEAIGQLPPNDQRVAWALGGIAEIDYYRGRLAPALEAINRSVAAHEASGQALNAGYGHVGRARIRRLAGDASGFHDDLAVAESAARQAGSAHDLVARCALERGLLARDAGKSKEAERWLRKALAEVEPSAEIVPAANGALGMVLCRAGRAEEGIGVARRAVEEARARGDRIIARVDLATCLAATGASDEARGEALRGLDEAEATGMVWETARAAAVALTLPQKAQPAGADEVRARGRKALAAFLEDCPGGEMGPAARLETVRSIRAALGA